MTNIEAKWLQEIRDNTKQLKRIADKLDVIARLVVNKSEVDAPQTDCPVSIVFGCDECHRPKCDCKNCSRCKWFATDKCHGSEAKE